MRRLEIIGIVIWVRRIERNYWDGLLRGLLHK